MDIMKKYYNIKLKIFLEKVIENIYIKQKISKYKSLR